MSLALILTFSFVPAYSSTQPKAGSACSKQGTSQMLQGKKFTCIKTGKKLIWNKGIAMKRPIPIPSATPSPNPSATPAPSPSPTFTIQVSGSDSLLPSSVCKLPDLSGNNFHLGFPITPIIKDLSQITVFAIPFEFTDSEKFRLSSDQTRKMFESITNYFYEESYGKTRLIIETPATKNESTAFTALSLGIKAQDSHLTKALYPMDFIPPMNNLLSKTPSTWNLGKYDAVVLYSQDTRTFNFMGGQAWRGTENSPLGQVPFDSPSGKIKSLVFGSGITTVMIHELGHSLFGFIDLYDQNGGQSYSQGWGLLAAAYNGEMNLRGWEKWLAGWLSEQEVRCAKTKSVHYLEFIASKSKTSKLLIHPLDNQRAIVVEAIDTRLTARENNGNLVLCNKNPSCQTEKRVGLLAYTVDVSKLSALGSISVPQQLMFPNLLADKNQIKIEDISVQNLGCDEKGCYVSLDR